MIIKEELTIQDIPEEYIKDSQIPISNFDDIDDKIIEDCLKYKKQGDF
jgi:hypothetical protein